MTVEDVTLDDLQGKMDRSAVPLAMRALPVFLVGLSAFNALGLVAGHPAAGVLFLPRRVDEMEFVSLLFLVGVVHAILLGGALFLRYNSQLAGMIRLDAGAQLADSAVMRQIAMRFGAPTGMDAPVAGRRKMFIGVMLALMVAGALLIPGPENRIWLVPVVTAAWIAVAAGVAWFITFGISAGGTTGALGLAAAGGLSLLFVAGGRGFEPSLQSVLVALIAFAATVGSLAFILTSHPSTDRVLRLQSTAGASRGLYKCEPLPDSGPVHLQFQLDESSPLLLFEAEPGSNVFRPRSVDSVTDPIPLHAKRIRIWNLRRLKQLVPTEIELHDRDDFVIASARVTQLLGSTALKDAELSDDTLMIAARHILDEDFAATLQVELNSAFHDYAETLAPDLAGLQARLSYAELELAGLDQVQSIAAGGENTVARLHTEWKELTTSVNSTLAKLKGGRSEALQLNEAWKQLIGERLGEAAGDHARGLSGDEAEQILALLKLKVTIVRTELGPAAAELKKKLSDLPNSIVGRFDEQRGWRKELILKLLGDPVTAAQFADVLGKNPELLGGAPVNTKDSRSEDAADPGLLGSDSARPGTPRNRN